MKTTTPNTRARIHPEFDRQPLVWLMLLLILCLPALSFAGKDDNNGKNPHKDGPGAPMFTQGDAAYQGQTNAQQNVSANAPAKMVEKFIRKVNQPPTIDWQTEQHTVVTAPATFNLQVHAYDSDTGIAQVEYVADGESIGVSTASPYHYQWANVTPGTYGIVATVTDTLGMSATTENLVIISNDPPQTSLMLPLANQEFEYGQSIALQASAYDSDGDIQQVQFFQNGLLIGSIEQSPYSVSWTPTEVGDYQLTALATDNHGAATYSEPVTIKVLDNEQVFYIHTDHLNTPRVLTDDNGDERWRWDNTDPFGSNPANESPAGKAPLEFNLRFPGQYYDKESGLHYNYFRDYDPKTGRYITSDPIGLAGGLDTYGYVRGNPLSYVDPFGLSPEDIEKIQQRFRDVVDEMTQSGLRDEWPFKNNQQRFWGRLTNDFVGDSRKLDCGEQTQYMNEKLTAENYDDNWTFYMNAGFGHAWGFALSSNVDDPIIYYDPRADEINLNEPCEHCKPWFGKGIYNDGNMPARPAGKMNK